MDESAPYIVPMYRVEPTRDQTLMALQLYEEVKCEGIVYYVGLEEKDLNKSEIVKFQEMLDRLTTNREMCRSVKHKAKIELEGTRERPIAWRHARVCRRGQAHSTARTQRQNFPHSKLADVYAQRGKELGAGAEANTDCDSKTRSHAGAKARHSTIKAMRTGINLVRNEDVCVLDRGECQGPKKIQPMSMAQFR